MPVNRSGVFAVMASEVRSLAQRSAEATKEIKTLISDSVEKVGVGTGQVAQAGATMQEIVSGIKRVADIVGEIASANREQSVGIAQINQSVTQLDNITQHNAARVEETSAASNALQEQARIWLCWRHPSRWCLLVLTRGQGLRCSPSSPFHQNAYMKLCLFQPGVVVRRCHSYGYLASSRLARLKNSSISFRNLFDETNY